MTASDPARRDVILGSVALIGATALPRTSAAADAGLAPAADLLVAARKFSATLDPDRRKAASFRWNGTEWKDWNYFGVAGYIKPGLRLEQMNAAQKVASWELLATIWSPNGLQKARNVMLLQDILAASGNGAGQRSSERFSLSLFGTPAETGSWGLRFEGHHLTQSVAIRDNRIVSVTPFSFSALPNRVTSGKYAGLNALKDEEALARGIIGDLSPALQRKARLSTLAMGNIMSYAGRERANAKKAGIAAAELTSGQRDVLWQLIETYTVDHLPSALTSAACARAGRRPRGRTLRMVRPQHAGEGVRLPHHRRQLRDRAWIGGRRRAAPAHDLPRSGQRARPR